VPGESPFILLVKLPLPEPSMVLLFVITGFELVDQHTPLEEISPADEEIVPPVIAEELVTEDTELVRIRTAVSSLPYLDNEGTSLLLPLLLTKSAELEASLPLLVTPCAETDRVRTVQIRIESKNLIWNKLFSIIIIKLYPVSRSQVIGTIVCRKICNRIT
jgi:hypothetical protein